MSTSEAAQSTPVLIVGGGPVGLSLALFLDYWDVPCTIFNIGATARMHPKGNGQNARTMEHYRQLGFSDEIRKLGLPSDHPFDQGFFTRWSKYEIYRYGCPSWRERCELRNKAPAIDQYVEPMYHVNQMYVEQLLFEKVKQCKNVDVRFRHQVNDFVESDDGVSVTVTDLERDESRTFKAKYMVDCSGGRSEIRRRLDIDYVGDYQLKDAWMAGLFYTIWLRIPQLYPKHLSHRKAWFYYSVNADRDTLGMMATLNGADEFVIFLKATDETKVPDDDTIKRKLGKAIDDPEVDIEVLAKAHWMAGAAMTVNKYQKGRVFLAGDSAHLFTPVGGFGLNTGVDDVHNLAWKLAAVHHGWGGPKLLDSYDLERRPIGFRNTGASRKYSTRTTDPQIPKEFEDDTPEGEEARKKAHEMPFIKYNHFNCPEEQDCTGVQLGARYDDSPLISSDSPPPEDKWPETYDTYHPSGVPGGRLPHIWLDEDHEMGSSLFDQLGKGFTLLRLDSSNTDTRVLERAAEAKGVPLKVLDVALPEARNLYERAFVLVRPDQYIAWRGDSTPEDCNMLLAQVCGF